MGTQAASSAGFALGHVFKAREARDHLKDVLDQAEAGGVAVVQRTAAVVVLRRDSVAAALRSASPLTVQAAVADGEFSFWFDGLPVHAVGADLDEAEDGLLDALLDYAELWFDELHDAPNHREFANIALLTAMFAGDREALRELVFGTDE